MMFHRILVPLDGSPRAEQALPIAARLAQTTGGTVVLLRVISTHGEFMLYPATYPEMVHGIMDAELEEANSYLKRVARASSLTGVHTEISVICSQVAPARCRSEQSERARSHRRKSETVPQLDRGAHP